MQPIQPDPNNNSFNPIPPAPGTNPQPLSPQHNPLVQMTGGSTPGSVPPSTPQPNPSFDNQIPSQPLVPQIGQYDQGSSLPPLDSSPYPTPVPDPQNSLPANPVPDFSQPQTAPPTTGSPDFGQPYQPSPQSNGVPEFSSPGQNNPIASSAQPSTTSSDPTNIDNLPLSSLGSQSDQPQPGLSGLHASSPAEPSTQASTPQPIPTPPASEPFDPSLHQMPSEPSPIPSGDPLGNFDPNAFDLSSQNQPSVSLDSIGSDPVPTQTPTPMPSQAPAPTPASSSGSGDDLDFDDDLDGFAPPISNRPDIKKIGIIAGGALLGFLGIILIVVSLLSGSGSNSTPTPDPVTVTEPEPDPEPTPAELEQAQADSLEKISRTTIASGLSEVDRYCFNFVMRSDNSLSSSKDCKLDTTYGQKQDNDFVVSPLKGEYETIEKVVAEWKQEQGSSVEIVKEQETLIDSVEAVSIIYKPASSTISSSSSSKSDDEGSDSSQNRSAIIVKAPILYLYNGSSYGGFVLDGSFGEEFAQLNYTDIIKSWRWKLPVETTDTADDEQSDTDTTDNSTNSNQSSTNSTN